MDGLTFTRIGCRGWFTYWLGSDGWAYQSDGERGAKVIYARVGHIPSFKIAMGLV